MPRRAHYADRAQMRRRYSTRLDIFEGPEPDYWVSNGYAVVHVDARGATHSGGVLWGPSNELAADIYDAIEWLAAEDWSNGKIGMVGNSYLAAAQYCPVLCRWGPADASCRHRPVRGFEPCLP